MSFNKRFNKKITYIIFERSVKEERGQGVTEVFLLIGGAILIGMTVFSLYGGMAKATALGLNASVQEVTGAIGNASQDAQDGVTICHVPAGNPDKARTMEVEQGDAHVHLAHGDYLGPCK